MAEKQPTAYVVLRYRLIKVPGRKTPVRADPRPVRVYDTRDEARSYARRMNKRSNRFQYTNIAVKQG